MTKTGQYKLFMSICLSILVTLITVILLVITKEKETIAIVFSMVIILACLAIAVNYMSLVNLRNSVDMLPQDYKDTYVNAQEVIGLSSISNSKKKEINQMILEIFEHAAMDQRDINEVIAGDLKGFLQPFISQTGHQLSMSYLLLYSAFLYVVYLLFMKLYKVIRPGFLLENFKTETLDFGITASYFLIAFVFFPWMIMSQRKAASEQWQGLKKLLLAIPFIIPIGLMFILIAIRIPQFVAILDLNVPIFPSVYHFAVGICIASILFTLMLFVKKREPRL